MAHPADDLPAADGGQGRRLGFSLCGIETRFAMLALKKSPVCSKKCDISAGFLVYIGARLSMKEGDQLLNVKHKSEIINRTRGACFSLFKIVLYDIDRM